MPGADTGSHHQRCRGAEKDTGREATGCPMRSSSSAFLPVTVPAPWGAVSVCMSLSQRNSEALCLVVKTSLLPCLPPSCPSLPTRATPPTPGPRAAFAVADGLCFTFCLHRWLLSSRKGSQVRLVSAQGGFYPPTGKFFSLPLHGSCKASCPPHDFGQVPSPIWASLSSSGKRGQGTDDVITKVPLRTIFPRN